MQPATLQDSPISNDHAQTTVLKPHTKDHLRLLTALFPERTLDDLQEKITLRPLTGGTVCPVYLITDVKSGNLALSIMRQQCPWHNLELRKEEDEICRWASYNGFSPYVLKSNPEVGVMELEYLPEGTVDPLDKNFLMPLATLVKKIARAPYPTCLKQQKQPKSFYWYERQWNSIKSHGELTESLVRFNQIKQKVESLLERSQLPLVVTHLGLHAENLLWSFGELKAIDWDMAGLDYEFVEIATIEMRYNLSAEEVERLLNHYIEGRDPSHKANYAFARPVPYLNKVTYPLTKALSLNPQLSWQEFEEIFQSGNFMDLNTIFSWKCDEFNKTMVGYRMWLQFAAAALHKLMHL